MDKKLICVDNSYRNDKYTFTKGKNYILYDNYHNVIKSFIFDDRSIPLLITDKDNYNDYGFIYLPEHREQKINEILDEN